MIPLEIVAMRSLGVGDLRFSRLEAAARLHVSTRSREKLETVRLQVAIMEYYEK
jgi:hypothetical protein